MPYYPPPLTQYLGKQVALGGVGGPTFFDPSSTNWFDNGWWGLEYNNGASVLTGFGRSVPEPGNPWITTQIDALGDHANTPPHWLLAAIYLNMLDGVGGNYAPFTYEASLDLVTPANDYSTLTVRRMDVQSVPVADLQTQAGVSYFSIGPTIPTADPHIVGRVWNSTGTLKISAG